MSEVTYDQGDMAAIEATFTDASGLADPDTVTLTIRLPDGSYMPPITPSHVSLGVYRYELLLEQSGEYRWRMVGEGTVFAAVQGRILVTESVFDDQASTDCFITLDDLEDYIYPGTGASTAQAEFAVSAACAAVRKAIGKFITLEWDVMVKLDGNGTDGLVLPYPPVRDVVSVVENGTTLTEDTDFVVRKGEGVLYKLDWDTWCPGRANVVVTYSRGYDFGAETYPGSYPGDSALPVPDDIRLVALELAKRILAAGASPGEDEGLTEEWMGNYRYNKDASSDLFRFTPGELAVLANYRPAGVA